MHLAIGQDASAVLTVPEGMRLLFIDHHHHDY
jgi:hypothetical protein